MMHDLMLRFADAAEWTAAAVMREPGVVEIDAVGTIVPVAPDGTIGAALTGWHVNLRCTDDRDLSALARFVVTPAAPARRWA